MTLCPERCEWLWLLLSWQIKDRLLKEAKSVPAPTTPDIVRKALREKQLKHNGMDHSQFKGFTPVVPLFSIVTRGEFSRRSGVKKTGAEVSSDA